MDDQQETEEDKICPWDYGDSLCDQENEIDEDSASNWSENEKVFEIASPLKRPGGNLLRLLFLWLFLHSTLLGPMKISSSWNMKKIWSPHSIYSVLTQNISLISSMLSKGFENETISPISCRFISYQRDNLINHPDDEGFNVKVIQILFFKISFWRCCMDTFFSSKRVNVAIPQLLTTSRRSRNGSIIWRYSKIAKVIFVFIW